MEGGTVFGPGRESGHTMLPVESDGVPAAPVNARGAQPLGYQMEGDTKVFNLTAEPVRWTLGKGIVATAWTAMLMLPYIARLAMGRLRFRTEPPPVKTVPVEEVRGSFSRVGSQQSTVDSRQSATAGIARSRWLGEAPQQESIYQPQNGNSTQNPGGP